MAATIKTATLNVCAGICGNILDHFDKALFVLLIPLISPLFFEETHLLTILIQTYGILLLGECARPLGAFFFGLLSDKYGRRNTLLLTITGLSLSSIITGFLPTYSQAGIMAPISLAITRIAFHFFASGESASAAIFVLEHAPPKWRPFFSGLFEMSTIIGFMLASVAITFLVRWELLESSWRALLWLGGLIGGIGLLLRYFSNDSKEFLQERAPSFSWKELRLHTGAIFSIAAAAGFSSATYIVSIVLMTGFLSLITAFDTVALSEMNNMLLFLDMLLLPLFGYLATKVSQSKLMCCAALLTVVMALPLFYNIENASFAQILLIRSFIVVTGVAFSAPLRSWAQERTPTRQRGTVIGLGYSLGRLVIEAPAMVTILWFFKMTGWAGAPGLYLMITGLAAACIVLARVKQPIREKVH